MKTLQLNLPKEIQKILFTLANNYDVYLVGGCVRDALLGIESHDIDCATNATPAQMKQALHMFKIIDTGIKHGTLTILHHGYQVEITTFRLEQGSLHHRIPQKLSFSQHLHDDLKRRDFTINALALTLDGKLIDEHHGLDDLHHHIIRCIGDPLCRFDEDALRILRALRFAYILNFSIEENTKNALLQKKKLLHSISMERKTHELMLMLHAPSHDLLKFLNDYHILEFFGFVYDPLLDQRLNECENDIECKLACLFTHPKQAKKILQQWKCSNVLIRHVATLLHEQNIDHEQELVKIRRILYEYQLDPIFIAKLFRFLHLDSHQVEQTITSHDYIAKLAINGNDIQKLGYTGKQIALAKQACLQLCYQHPASNQKDILQAFLQKKKAVL